MESVVFGLRTFNRTLRPYLSAILAKRSRPAVLLFPNACRYIYRSSARQCRGLAVSLEYIATHKFFPCYLEQYGIGIVFIICLPCYAKQFAKTLYRILPTVFHMQVFYRLSPAFFLIEILNLLSETLTSHCKPRLENARGLPQGG